MRKKERAKRVLTTLKVEYPHAHCALNYTSPHELLIATILSAQCTDERVNKVTADLFQKYPNVEAFAQAPLEELEQDVKPTGFYRNKAKSISRTSQLLLERHQGEVPKSLEKLTALPGVGRKTANVVLGNAFNIASGVVVDTHVRRLSQRLGLTRNHNPEHIEKDLNALIPKKDWVMFPHLMIFHGRAVCKSRKPLCAECVLNAICPSAQ